MGAVQKYTIQRCNAHLVREIKMLWQKNSDYIPAKTAYKKTYQKIDHDAKNVLYGPPDERVKHHKRLTAGVRKLVRRYKDDMVVGRFMAKLERAIHDIFRFVLNPRIPPTNNLAEQSLREYVIQRTIRGCLRSKKSMKWLGAMLTCITTWKNLGINYAVQAAKCV